MAKRPTAKERDERIKVDLDPETFIGKIMETGPGPVIDAYSSNGPSGRTWRISCRTCGWEIQGEGETPESAQDEARAHNCGESLA